MKLSEEEKKAIEDMNSFANGVDLSCVSAKQMKLILNLIEKQQKENEELKAKLEYKQFGDLDNPEFENYIEEIKDEKIEKMNKEIEELRNYISYAPNLDEMTATKYINIRKEAYIDGRNDEQQRAEQIIYENYIPKSKIEDKINEINDKFYIKDELELMQ